MPTHQIDEDGAVLYYEDTGAPNNAANYTTIVMVHGLVFHSATFRRLLEPAVARNLRIITINTREYPGSSPLTESEFSQLTSSDKEVQEAALRNHAMGIANFVAWIIKDQNIPAPQADADGHRVGGIMLVHWSLGNLLLVSLLANIGLMEGSTRTTLEQYLRTVVVYDPPAVVYGGDPVPEIVYTPFSDPAIPPQDIANQFILHVATNFEPVTNLRALTADVLAARKDMTKVTSDQRYVPTTSRMTPEELEGMTTPSILPRMLPYLLLPQPIHQENIKRAMFDTKGQWPNVKALVLWADMTCSYSPWGAKHFLSLLDQPVAPGESRREISFVKLADSGHFLHWEDPERMIKLLVEHL